MFGDEEEYKLFETLEDSHQLAFENIKVGMKLIIFIGFVAGNL